MLQHLIAKLHERVPYLMHAIKQPKAKSVSRIVIITHVVYYVIATIGISHSVVYTVTSGACALVLILEYIAEKNA